MKYAAYYKRIISSIIDLLILYASLLAIYCFLYFFYPWYCDLGFVLKITFFFGIFYHVILYKNEGKTYGERFLGLKLIFIKDTEYQIFYYLGRGFLLSLIYFPFAFPTREVAITFIIGSILLQLSPKARAKKMLLWDLMSNAVVVEESSIPTEDDERA
jgi:RDD family.